MVFSSLTAPGGIRRQVDRHVVAAGVDDDVLRLTPDLAALVEPRKASHHASARSIGEAESAAVADVDGEPVIPVRDQRCTQRQLDKRVIVERLTGVAVTSEAGISDVAGADDVVATRHVPGVARHGCVIGSTNIAWAQHTHDWRRRWRHRGIGAIQTRPVELNCESAGSRETSPGDDLQADDLARPRSLTPCSAGTGEINIVDDPPGFGGERYEALQTGLREELHAHVALLTKVHRERQTLVDRRIDRLQQTIATHGSSAPHERTSLIVEPG